MIKTIKSFLPKPFAKITVNGSCLVIKIEEVPGVLCNESDDAKLELIWMSERRFSKLPEFDGF